MIIKNIRHHCPYAAIPTEGLACCPAERVPWRCWGLVRGLLSLLPHAIASPAFNTLVNHRKSMQLDLMEDGRTCPLLCQACRLLSPSLLVVACPCPAPPCLLVFPSVGSVCCCKSKAWRQCRLVRLRVSGVSCKWHVNGASTKGRQKSKICI